MRHFSVEDARRNADFRDRPKGWVAYAKKKRDKPSSVLPHKSQLSTLTFSFSIHSKSATPSAIDISDAICYSFLQKTGRLEMARNSSLLILLREVYFKVLVFFLDGDLRCATSTVAASPVVGIPVIFYCTFHCRSRILTSTLFFSHPAKATNGTA